MGDGGCAVAPESAARAGRALRFTGTECREQEGDREGRTLRIFSLYRRWPGYSPKRLVETIALFQCRRRADQQRLQIRARAVGRARDALLSLHQFGSEQ